MQGRRNPQKSLPSRKFQEIRIHTTQATYNLAIFGAAISERGRPARPFPLREPYADGTSAFRSPMHVLYSQSSGRAQSRALTGLSSM